MAQGCRGAGAPCSLPHPPTKGTAFFQPLEGSPLQAGGWLQARRQGQRQVQTPTSCSSPPLLASTLPTLAETCQARTLLSHRGVRRAPSTWHILQGAPRSPRDRPSADRGQGRPR